MTKYLKLDLDAIGQWSQILEFTNSKGYATYLLT